MSDQTFQIKIAGDVAQLQSMVESATRSINSLMTNASLQSVKLDALLNGNMRRTQQTSDSVISSIRNQFNGALNSSFSAAGLAAGAGVAGLTAMTIQIGRAVSEMERLRLSVRNVMQDQALGDQAFAWLKQLAIAMPTYGVADLAKSFVVLKNQGLDPTNGSLEAIANSVAKAGGNTEILNRAVLQFSQAWGKGKLAAEDVKPLIEAGIPVYKLLGEVMHKNIAELQEMQKNGELTRKQMVLLFKAMDEDSKGAAESLGNTLGGKWASMTDTVLSSIDDINQQGGFTFMRTTMDLVSAAIPPVMSIISGLGSVVNSVFDSIGNITSSVFGMFKTEISSSSGLFRDFFGREFPSLSQIASGALKSVELGFITLGGAIEMIVTGAVGAIKALGQNLAALAAPVGLALQGDWKAASASFSAIPGNVKTAWNDVDREVNNIEARMVDRLSASMAKYGQVTTIPALKRIKDYGARDAASQPDAKKKEKKAKKEKEDPSLMPIFEEQLGEYKIDFEKRNDLRELTLVQEKNWWVKRLNLVEKDGKDYNAIQKKINNLELQELKRTRKEKEALQNQAIENEQREGLNKIDVQSDIAKRSLELGLITQEQELRQEAEFEEQRYALELAALNKRKELLKNDPEAKVKTGQIDAQMMQLTNGYQRQYSGMLNKIKDASVAGRFGTDMKTKMFGWLDDGMTGIMNRSITMKGVLSRVWQDTSQLFLKYLVIDPLQNFITGQLTQLGILQTTEAGKTAVTAAGEASRTSIISFASLQNIAVKSWEFIKTIGMKAAEAAAGVWASVSSMPGGWIIAPVLAATAFAGVMKLASAEGGWDIGKGMTGIMRYHEEEMMLPKEHANTIRALGKAGVGQNGQAIGSGGTSSSGINVTYNDHSGRLTKTDIQKNIKVIADGLRDYSKRSA